MVVSLCPGSLSAWEVQIFSPSIAHQGATGECRKAVWSDDVQHVHGGHPSLSPCCHSSCELRKRASYVCISKLVYTRFWTLQAHVVTMKSSIVPMSQSQAGFAAMMGGNGSVMAPIPPPLPAFYPAPMMFPYGMMTDRLQICPDFMMDQCNILLCPLVHPGTSWHHTVINE